MDFSAYLIFTDGACTGNPGPGGWASIIAKPSGIVREIGGRSPQTTNNRMELLAPIRALESIEAGSRVIIYTDSTYVIRGITQWVWGWRKRGWKNAKGTEVLNRELWEDLSRQVARLGAKQIEWKYVRGHTGVPGNERCDVIAVAFAKDKPVRLYDGPLLNYGHALHDLPPDQDLPEMRERTAAPVGPKPGYLSYVGGEVWHHETWAECERRVKGQAGAKFKKAVAGAEPEVLLGWGLNPSAVEIKKR